MEVKILMRISIYLGKKIHRFVGIWGFGNSQEVPMKFDYQTTLKSFIPKFLNSHAKRCQPNNT